MYGNINVTARETFGNKTSLEAYSPVMYKCIILSLKYYNSDSIHTITYDTQTCYDIISVVYSTIVCKFVGTCDYCCYNRLIWRARDPFLSLKQK